MLHAVERIDEITADPDLRVQAAGWMGLAQLQVQAQVAVGEQFARQLRIHAQAAAGRAQLQLAAPAGRARTDGAQLVIHGNNKGETFLPNIEDVMREAAARILDVYNSEFAVQHKLLLLETLYDAGRSLGALPDEASLVEDRHEHGQDVLVRLLYLVEEHHEQLDGVRVHQMHALHDRPRVETPGHPPHPGHEGEHD
mgnify:CR=1 FL=1